MHLDFDHLLNGLDGVAYVIDRNMMIVGLGSRNWNAFALANGGASLVDGNGVLGRSLFDFIEGDDVAFVYRRWINGLIAAEWPRGRVISRCDAPGIRRELMILISPIHGGAGVERILFQSVTVIEHVRPRLELFDFAGNRSRGAAGQALPVLSMCSYCQDVRYPVGSTDQTGAWISAEDYYHRGGGSEVRISHGICPPCLDRAEAALAAAPGALAS
jgi:hypothetical protein